jgi:hypothetical protein
MARAVSQHRSPGLADHVGRRRSVRTARSRLLGESVDRIGVALIATLIALAVLGGEVAAKRMAGMDAGPGSIRATSSFFFIVWVVIRAAMISTSSGPMVAVYARLS